MAGLVASGVMTGLASAQSNPTLGFASSATETTTGTADVPLTLVIPGGSFISALQFDIDTDDVSLESISESADLNDFVVDSRTMASGVTRVIAYAQSGRLTPRTYNAAFTLHVTTESHGTIAISNLIGAEDSDFGDDANLQAGTANHTVTLALPGDANGDYDVDLTDVALEIDAIFDVNQPGADLHPWGSPDGQIDVRDLLILVRAVLADEWPDGSPLSLADAGKAGTLSKSSSSENNRIDLSGAALSLSAAEPIKVLMVTLHGPSEADFLADSTFDGTIITGIHRSSGALRVMFYRLDGTPLPQERTPLGSLGVKVSHLEAEAVSMDGKRFAIDAGISVGTDADRELPENVVLTQNYPNPFNPTTQFELDVPETQQVEVAVFNLYGQRVAALHSGVLVAGSRTTFRFDAADLSSGQYFYRAQGEHFLAVRGMTLMK